jgi:hypothetical protein
MPVKGGPRTIGVRSPLSVFLNNLKLGRFNRGLTPNTCQEVVAGARHSACRETRRWRDGGSAVICHLGQGLCGPLVEVNARSLGGDHCKSSLSRVMKPALLNDQHIAFQRQACHFPLADYS